MWLFEIRVLGSVIGRGGWSILNRYRLEGSFIKYSWLDRRGWRFSWRFSWRDGGFKVGVDDNRAQTILEFGVGGVVPAGVGGARDILFMVLAGEALLEWDSNGAFCIVVMANALFP